MGSTGQSGGWCSRKGHTKCGGSRLRQRPNYSQEIKDFYLVLLEKQKVLKRAQQENQELKLKEQLLLQSIKGSADILYHLGQLLSGCLGADLDTAAMVEALMVDVQAQELLSTIHGGEGNSSICSRIGNSSSSNNSGSTSNTSSGGTCVDNPRPGTAAGADEGSPQYTNMLRQAACTPERLQWILTATLDDIAGCMKQQVMRMAFLLNAHPLQQPVVSDSLMQLVDEYGQLNQLMHVAADNKLMRLCLRNLDTMEEQQPPSGHWDMVAEQLLLEPDQAKQLEIGFGVYARKRAKLISVQEPIVESIHQLLQPLYNYKGARGMIGCGLGSSAAVARAAAVEVCASANAAVAAAAAGIASTQLQDDPPQAPAAAGSAYTQLQGCCVTAVSAGAAGADGSSSCNGAVVAETPPLGGRSLLPEPPPAAAAAAAACNDDVWQGLDLEAAERLQQLLGQLNKVMRQIREVQRPLAFQFINVLNTRQRAAVIVYSFPFIPQMNALCEAVVRLSNQGLLSTNTTCHVATN